MTHSFDYSKVFPIIGCFIINVCTTLGIFPKMIRIQIHDKESPYGVKHKMREALLFHFSGEDRLEIYI